MATLVLLTPDAHLWSVDGVAATVTQIRPAGVYALVAGERTPVLLDLTSWRVAMSCEYCARPAEVQLRDGQPGDVLCRVCARAQFDRPADWVRPIPRAVIRALYPECDRLG
jgi:hypothetical protein